MSEGTDLGAKQPVFGPVVTVGVVVLTFNRPEQLRRAAAELVTLGDALEQIIVIDNCSDVPAATVLADLRRIVVVRTERNEGASARNRGIEHSRADVVVTLDDDVFGLTADSVERIRSLFRDERLACVNFHVRHPLDNGTMNWIHPYPKERYANQSFITDEISEGAAAFRRSYLLEVGLYPESFFISHEGPDVAFRLLDRGYEIRYCPRISVFHDAAPQGRPGWRRYYFDTRNVFWLVARNLPIGFAIRKVMRQVGAMFVYALRDGFLRYWFKAVWDGIAGMPAAIRDRRVISPETMAVVRKIERHRPGLIHWIRTRLTRRGVQL